MKHRAWKTMASRCTKPETFTHTISRPLELVQTAFLFTQQTWNTNNGELQFDLNSRRGLLPRIGIKPCPVVKEL